MTEKLDYLAAFAGRHKIIFENEGEIGFGRPAVGFVSRAGAFVDYNPWDYYADGEIHTPFPEDRRLNPPPALVPDAYHKHTSLSVLVHGADYDEALNQLYEWVKYLEGQGELEIRQYERKHDNPFSLMLHGPFGYALCYKEAIPDDARAD